MPRFIADEGFNRDVLRRVIARNPAFAIVRAQDAGLSGASDPDILEWAAQEGRVVLTHDKRTMTRDTNARLVAGLPMPGVVVVRSASRYAHKMGYRGLAGDDWRQP